MKKDLKIGVFDYGIGGITVLKEIIKILPNEKYFYYSDSKNNPYGDKNIEEIQKICDNILKYLLNKGCNLIVIACNTASAISAQFLREKYSNIPIVAIEPAYKMVHDYAYNGRTLVMATKGTIESEKFNLLYTKYNNYNTELLACKGLADLIEEGNKKKIKQYLQNEIGGVKNKVDNVVLGCTHYPLIQNEISQVLGKVKFFNGAERLAIHLKQILIDNNVIFNDKNSEYSIEFEDSSKSDEKRRRFFKLLAN